MKVSNDFLALASAHSKITMKESFLTGKQESISIEDFSKIMEENKVINSENVKENSGNTFKFKNGNPTDEFLLTMKYIDQAYQLGLVDENDFLLSKNEYSEILNSYEKNTSNADLESTLLDVKS